MKTEKTYSIAELANEFDVSTRTIRYYEEIGLLAPRRSEGGHRIFTRKEYTQLMLIFRGKKFGFQLDEIQEMILLFDRDRTGKKQLERTIEYGKEKLEEVTANIEELEQIRQEMEHMLGSFVRKLNDFEGEKNDECT